MSCFPWQGGNLILHVVASSSCSIVDIPLTYHEVVADSAL